MKPLICLLGRFLLRSVDKNEPNFCAPEKVATVQKPADFFKEISSGHLLALDTATSIWCDSLAWQRLLTLAVETGAGLLYSDYLLADGHSFVSRPLSSCQQGAIRDDFHFGHCFLLCASAIKKALQKHGGPPEDGFAAFYDLRLKISIDSQILHVPEFLYTASVKQRENKPEEKREAHFDYVARKNLLRQKKYEKAATDYLKRIGAYLPARKKKAEISAASYPVEASVIIPVRNRKKTIADALASALSQKTNFPYNIIVVDNHSTDGTGEILRKYAAKYPYVHHLAPTRRDLGIGGCWNEAIYSTFCGKYAIQLDSDDLYSSSQTLQKIVDEMKGGGYAALAGAYTLVNEELKPILPGLIDHSEWTKANGHNNLLRVNGAGAPRAFDTGVVRKIGFPNVSYGEDYAVLLRLSRDYAIGRIYENLYLCRRWSDNTDAGLPFEIQNRHNDYKDKLRTLEIAARQKKNIAAISGKRPSTQKTSLTQEPRLAANERTSEIRHQQNLARPIAPPDAQNRQATELTACLPDNLFGEYPGAKNQTLPELCHHFYKTQKKVWPALSLACRDLKKNHERKLSGAGFQAVLQFNPGRALSSGAAVDQASIQKRPCFLCARNRPAQQSGILYRTEYLILCNPAPIFPNHFTVVAREHLRQNIIFSLDSLLQIAFDVAPDYAVFYNGPACGASAPDHLHFQITPCSALPFLNLSPNGPSYQKISATADRLLDNSGRSMILLSSDNAEMIKNQFLRLLACVGKVLHTSEEPLINVLCWRRKKIWRLMVFLRQKHRPDAYFAKGEAKIFVSPGAVDMAGVVITPLIRDFRNLDCDALSKIYREISLSPENLNKIIAMWEQEKGRPVGRRLKKTDLNEI